MTRRLAALFLLAFLLVSCEAGDYVFSVEGFQVEFAIGTATAVPGSPTPTQTQTPTPTPTVEPTPVPTAVPTQTPIPTPEPTAVPTATPLPVSTITVYDDRLAQGWGDWSWGTLRSFSSAGLVYEGQYSLALTYNHAWSGLFLPYWGQPFAPDGTLSFVAHGGATTKTIYVQAVDGNYEAIPVDGVADNVDDTIPIEIPAGSWREFDIALSDLSPNGTSIRGFFWMSGVATSMTMDDIRIVQGAPTPTPEPTAGPTPTAGPGTEGMGANMAWLCFGHDFGGQSECRVSNVEARGGAVTVNGHAINVVDRLAAAAIAGARQIKWLMFMSDPAWAPMGPNELLDTDGNSCPDTLDNGVYEDVDAALRMVGGQGMTLELGLFLRPSNYPDGWFEEPCVSEMAAMFRPMFERYATDTTLAGWNVILEPEWDLQVGLATIDQIRHYGTVMADTVHEAAPQYVAVESINLSHLNTWDGVPVDVLQFSWYDGMALRDWATQTTEADLQQQLGTDRPICVGEFYAGGADAYERWNYLLANYSCSYGWSLVPEGTSADDQMVIIWP